VVGVRPVEVLAAPRLAATDYQIASPALTEIVPLRCCSRRGGVRASGGDDPQPHPQNRRSVAAQRCCANFVRNSSRKFLFLEALCCCCSVVGAAPHTNVYRAAIDSKEADHHVPVAISEIGHPTSEPNGTTIGIEKIQLKRIDPNSIIRHIDCT
jgi:hypothetical protein